MTANMKARAEILVTLKCVPYIRYLIQFQKDKIQALITFGSEVNVITPTFVAELGFVI